MCVDLLVLVPFVTELQDGFKIFAIGHRRGGEVHTFVASCGITIPGVPQAYREDIGVYGSMEPRKCPKVLNLWSQQQPKIDKNNRFRQDILAIEERFVTKSFPFRVFTSVLGITFANAYEWFNYFIDSKRYITDDGFLAFMRSLAYDGMHNKFDTEQAEPASPSAAAVRAAASPARPMPAAREEASDRGYQVFGELQGQPEADVRCLPGQQPQDKVVLPRVQHQRARLCPPSADGLIQAANDSLWLPR